MYLYNLNNLIQYVHLTAKTSNVSIFIFIFQIITKKTLFIKITFRAVYLSTQCKQFDRWRIFDIRNVKYYFCESVK